ncbi:MAG: asparaginase [Thermoleophilia bacterium]
MSGPPRIRLLATGGTIAFRTDEGGATPQAAGAELLGTTGVTGLAVDVVDVASVSSIALRDQDLVALAAEVRASAGLGYDGVVVAHGTDTLEETAYFLALTCPSPGVPVVLTGAMRHDGSPGADGPANLRDALLAAAEPVLAAVGPVVVWDGEIHAARFVAKTHGTRAAAFASLLAGPVGCVVEQAVELWLAPTYRDALGALESAPLPRVELLPMTIGTGPEHGRAVLRTSPAGVVIDGFGAGHVAPAALDVVDAAVDAGVPVVVASRCGAGPTLAETYGVPGTEIDLRRRGALMAGALAARKARLRLAVALALGLRPEEAFPQR